MGKQIITQSVGLNVAKTSPVILDKTPDTRLILIPLIHEGGVKGTLVRIKKKRTDSWEDLNVSSFQKHNLLCGEKIEIVLRTKVLKKLLVEVASRQEIVKDGIKYGYNEYVTVEKEKVVIIDDHNKKHLLEQILSKGYSEEFWSLLNSSDPELADRLSAGRLQAQRRKIIIDLKSRLQQDFPETNGKDSWQKWIYTHNWLFGANYQPPIEKQKINITGIMPDYLFPTLDGFIDILEIKLPSFDVIEEDKDHKGSWVWSKRANYAIGQVVNYLSEIDRLRFEIEKQIYTAYQKEISMLKPRAFILIGQKEGWLKSKKEGLRKLNHSLHGIEIITYSDLVKRGEMFIESGLKDYEE